MSTPILVADGRLQSKPGATGWSLPGRRSARILRILTTDAKQRGSQHARAIRRSLRTVSAPVAVARLLAPPDRADHTITRLREPVATTVERFRLNDEPIHLMIHGFPHKEQRGRLRATGPLPDLAEASALARLHELRTVVTSLHPPGVRVTILSDGGYYCRRPVANLLAYRNELRTLLTLLALDDFVSVTPLTDALRHAVGPDTWLRRDRLVSMVLDEVREAVEPARHGYALWSAMDRLERRSLVQFGVPPFGAVLQHYLRASEAPRTMVGSLRALRKRQSLRKFGCTSLELAWQDAAEHLATAIVDERLGIFDALPAQIRLHTTSFTSGAACNLPFLGDVASTWNGTAFVDHHGRVRVACWQALVRQGFVPVRSALLAHGQPWFMIPAELSQAFRSKIPQAEPLLSVLASSTTLRNECQAETRWR